MTCRYCPLRDADHCRGQDVPRYCELLDPAHPAYDPRFGPIVIAETARFAHPDLARLDRALAAAGTGRKPGGCCPGA
jgi:hypothetical protein